MQINSKATIKQAIIQMRKTKQDCLYIINDKNDIIGMVGYEEIFDYYLKGIDILTPLEKTPFHTAHKKNTLTEANLKIPEIDQDIREKMDLYYGTLENMPLSIFISDANGNIIYLNKKFENTTKVDRKHLLGKNISYVEQLNLFWPTITPIILNEKRQLSITQNVTRSDLKTVVTGIPIFDKNDRIKWVVTASRELQKEELQAKESSLINTHHLKDNTLIFKSRRMKDIFQLTKQIATALSTVLITGESGVGKDVIAELIHEQSDRHDQDFIHINCGAIPESLLESELFGYETGAFSGADRRGKKGLVEAANHGTLFLDEIGEMPLNLQVKLLQVIQNKTFTRVGGTKQIKVDIRIIAATNTDLMKLIEKGEFRLDLFYRLNVIPIHIPPLRERVEDIVPLANLFLETYVKKQKKDIQFTLDFEEGLKRYTWPGNIRELDNLIERLVVISNGRFIDKNNLPENMMLEQITSKNNTQEPAIEKSISIEQISPLKEAISYVESQLIQMAYHNTKNSYKVAELLEISQSTAHRKIQQYIKEYTQYK